jgi:long-chain acyl-CoA synthetase
MEMTNPGETISTVFARMRANGNAPALFWQDQDYTYETFCKLVGRWSERLVGDGVGSGTVCGFMGEYSPNTCALMYALMQRGAILVPFTPSVEAELRGFMELAGVQALYRFDPKDAWTLEVFPDSPQNQLLESFRTRQIPGLVVFTSGSTGKPKGILHDCERVMHKFAEPRTGWRTVLFLMMDHFGGFNTLLSTFAYGGAAVCVADRTPEVVCRAIQRGRATLLPTTPTFLNLLVASGCCRDFDLSSVNLITYGTEVMSEATLRKIRASFPNAQLKQTYGLSELGVLRSSSESDDSVWVKIGGRGFDVKIIDNVLWVRSEANMVGYLNSASPFDEDGWMCTGDEVEVRGEYVRILGRKSEMINVGGQKVFPVEVETVLLEDKNVSEVTVYGAMHPLMGYVVHARVSLHRPEDSVALSERLRRLCVGQLARYKVPVKVHVVNEEEQHNVRFKKIRRDGEIAQS